MIFLQKFLGTSWGSITHVAVTLSDSVGLTYDALGRMAEQNRSGAYTQIVYAPAGQKLALMSASMLQKAFIPLPGNAQAVYNSSGLSYYRHPDWLGSSRFASTPTPPTAMYSDTAYAPFGEPYAQAGTTDLSFTGQNQDTVAGGLTGPYDFPAREYGPQGRWVSPDPLGILAVDPTNPQSWNRYAYVLNNPVDLIDPSGLFGNVPPGCIVSHNGPGKPSTLVCLPVISGPPAGPAPVLSFGAAPGGPGRRAANNGQQPQHQPQLTQQQLAHQKCLAWGGATAALVGSAGLNELGALVTGEISPVSAIFHGIAVVETAGAGITGAVAWYYCSE